MTTQPPHVALDEAIVAAIAEGPKTFGAIQDARGTRDDNGRIQDSRVLDYRLRALKRAGKIKFDRPAEGQPKRWMLA